jgi:hypothetical protein
MELEIRPRKQLITRSTGVVWGPTKCGKTVLMSTLPKPLVFFILDPEGSASVPVQDDVFIVDLSDLSAQEQVQACRNKIPTMIENELPKGTTSVVLDSLTILNWSALQEAVRQKIGQGKGFVPTLEAPGLSAYGGRTNYVNDSVRNILRATAKMNLNCWFTAHQDEPTLGKDQQVLYTTLTLSGKAINQTGLQLSEIWHLREKDGRRYISVQNSRGRQPMGTRMFLPSQSEFELKFKPGVDQPMTEWIAAWKKNNYQAIPLPTVKGK